MLRLDPSSPQPPFAQLCAQVVDLVATGGLAPLFQQTDELFDAVEDTLTMHGLTVIHKFNQHED